MNGPTIEIWVPGRPKPKGSLKHVGRGRLVEQVEGSSTWRATVAAHALRTVTGRRGEFPLDGPVSVQLALLFRRPKSVKRDAMPCTRSTGDIDKHARNCLDALVDAAVIGDDGQVVWLAVSMLYDPDGREGALINVSPATAITPLPAEEADTHG